MSEDINTLRHESICCILNKIYKSKNADYGDSFGETYEKLGIVSAVTRIADKTNRLVNLMNAEANVEDETIEDTLLDLANYAIMTVMELQKRDPELNKEYECDLIE